MPVSPAFTYQIGLYGSYIFGVFQIRPKDTWRNSLIIPLIATFLSGGALLLQVIINTWRKSSRAVLNEAITKSTTHSQEDAHTTHGQIIHNVHVYTQAHGGKIIFAFKVARLFGNLSLLSLALLSIVRDAESHQSGWESPLNRQNMPNIALATTYWYTSFLAALSLVPSIWSRTVTRHANVVLLVAFGVYAYRDIWPLATFTQKPADSAEGSLLWARIAVLAFTAILIPLFIPRQYIPVDPEHPMEVPSSEQTASIFSLMVYSFLDPMVLEAYRVPHLSHERLPPLCDYDASERLIKYAYPYLDPFHGAKKNRHIFFGLMGVFFWEFTGMALSLTAQALARFASPVAVNRILAFLEGSDEREIFIRPWVWVLCLFFGPLLVSAAFQWYIFLATRTLAHTQAILTQLVFEHSLRIRFKAEASGDAHPGNPAVIPAETPESGSVLEGGSGGSDTQSARSTAKGKAKAGPATPSQEPKKKANLIGKINTLVTVDVDTILGSKDFLIAVLQVPIELALAISFLYIVLGWSAFVGLASIILLLPVPGYLAGRIQSIHAKKMEKTDARVEAVTETIGILRMVKFFGWDQKMNKNLEEKREEEIAWLFKDKVVNLLTKVINFLIPTITMVVTYATYTLIMKQPLNASKVFSSMTVFDIVRNGLHQTSWSIGMMIKGKVALDRVGGFLRETELLDIYSEESCTEVVTTGPTDHDGVIGFNDATFAWSKDAEDGTQTPLARSFRLKINGKLTFKRNVLNLIVGPTGSGKTSILMALLGEMHFMPPAVDSWFNLPRSGGVAYAAQESWVQNETIKENILFGSPYDDERYKKVIRQCSLERDLELFEAGDETEVGEKGLTLSGGQKARVTLARAVYSSAEIILLDDVLAALDVHTSKSIVNECFRGDLLRGRTVLLVTHNVALTSPIADHIVSIGLDGIAHEASNISEVLAQDQAFAHEVEKEQEEVAMEKEVIDTVKKDESEPTGKLILAEEIAQGRVSWKAVKLLLVGLGGGTPVLFLMLWMGGLMIMHFSNTFAVWFLGFWGSQYESHYPSEVPVSYYLGIYSALLALGVLTYVTTSIYYNFGTQRASRYISSQLIQSIIGSTFRWLDETPASRIIARCTQDIAAIDTPLTQHFASIVELVVNMCCKLAGPVIFTPIFALPGILITILGIFIGKVYLKAQMSIKREMSNARSPVLAHFGASIVGLISIRAYGAEKPFKAKSLKRIDHYTKVSRTSYNLNRWTAFRLDLLGASFTTALASYLLVTRKIGASNVGFSLNMAIEFCALILWLVGEYSQFQVQCNSLERIQAYIDIDHEPKPTEAGKPPAAWPKSGELRVENLSARYSSTGPKVLHDLSFHVKSGERIGIVGRTGSGKSSLTLSLLRCILTEGNVIYDGIPTRKLNLDALRSSITIIPQVPELLSGSLRRNLDPFEQNDDVTLNNALRASGLFTLQIETDEARLTLDSKIASGGNNLSVGQRQIIALARAIVRNSKLLILDEATSAIDHKTDSIIQSTLRNELGSDVTVLTVAHRLQTIMDADKIMVLEDGRIAEFDSPQALLQKKGSQFKSMVDGSGDRQALYSMVKRDVSGSA